MPVTCLGTSRRPATRLAVGAAALTVLAGCTSAPRGTPTHRAPPRPSHGCSAHRQAQQPPARWDHVIWIVFENRPYDAVIGSSDAPYLNQLAAECGLATDYHGVAHPSLPNYLALAAGSTFGVTDDDPPAAHPIAAPTIFSLLTQHGATWASYQEDMPSPCATSSAGEYAVKHNAAPYFTTLRAECATQNVPLGTTRSGPLADALAHDALPAFSVITPNLCNDMHDCPVATGDAWLARWLPRILKSHSYRRQHTAVFVFGEEDTADATANHVMQIVVAPSVPRGLRVTVRLDHYSLLRTTMQLLGLPVDLGAAAGAPSMAWGFNLLRQRLRPLPSTPSAG